MGVAALRDLEPQRCRTVVINVHTELVATRAVLSAVEVAKEPLLLVNCDPTADSTDHFSRLAASYGFDVIEAPLRLHGECLDWLFTELHDERLLLLDSDAEVRDAAFVTWMHEMLDHEQVFGAGFTQGPHEVPDHWFRPAGTVVYMERPWVPCTMLKVADAKEALAAGRSFRPRYEPNDFGTGRRLSKFVAARWGLPWGGHSKKFNRLPGWLRARARTWPLDRFVALRSRYYFVLRPSMVMYDTAADVYEHLRYGRGRLYAGLPVELAGSEVHHYSGMSRYVLDGEIVDDTSPEAVRAEVTARLLGRYAYDWEPGGADGGATARNQP